MKSKSIHVTINGTTPVGGKIHKDMYFTVGKYPKSAFNNKKPKQFRSQGKVANIREIETGFYVEFDTGHAMPFKDENVEAQHDTRTD